MWVFSLTSSCSAGRCLYDIVSIMNIIDVGVQTHISLLATTAKMHAFAANRWAYTLGHEYLAFQCKVRGTSQEVI